MTNINEGVKHPVLQQVTPVNIHAYINRTHPMSLGYMGDVKLRGLDDLLAWENTQYTDGRSVRGFLGDRAVQDTLQVKTTMPHGLVRKHLRELQASTGVDTDTVSKLGLPMTTDGSVDGGAGCSMVIPLTDAQEKRLGKLDPVQVMHLSPTARGRLVQLAEHPHLITDYLSSGITANKLAAMVDMTVGGFESWCDSCDLMEYYSRGRMLGSDVYFDKACDALDGIEDISSDVYALTSLMASSEPDDAEAMEKIRAMEWRLGVMKVGAEYSQKAAKTKFDSYLKLAGAVAPERYAPRQSKGANIAQGSVNINILLDENASAHTKVADGALGVIGKVVQGGADTGATIASAAPSGIVIEG